MIFLEFIKDIFRKKPFLGVLDDTRPYFEKQEDIQNKEVVGTSLVTWEVKPQNTWKKFKLRNQVSSESCVAQSNAKANDAERKMKLNENIESSALDIYDRRINKPSGGMIPYEGIKIICDYGVTSEALLPSQNLGEALMNEPVYRTKEMISVAEKYKGGVPVVLENTDINAIAAVLDQKIPVTLCFQFSQGEWSAFPTLKYKGSIRHCVTATDRTVYDGQKCLIIEDSALVENTINGQGQRLISEEFLIERCFFAGYRKQIPLPAPYPKPVHTFTINMRFGEKNKEIFILQQRLKHEGVFPNIEPTGYFGVITKNAVIDYQRKKGLPDTGFCGPMTRHVLNS